MVHVNHSHFGSSLHKQETKINVFETPLFDMKPWAKATVGVVLSLSSSSNNSIRYCPPTARPSTRAACAESSFSCIDSWDASGSFLLWETLLPMVLHLQLFPFRNLHVALQLVQCPHQLGATPVFRVFVGLRAQCSATLNSRLLRIVHNIGFVDFSSLLK